MEFIDKKCIHRKKCSLPSSRNSCTREWYSPKSCLFCKKGRVQKLCFLDVNACRLFSVNSPSSNYTHQKFGLSFK